MTRLHLPCFIATVAGCHANVSATSVPQATTGGQPSAHITKDKMNSDPFRWMEDDAARLNRLLTERDRSAQAVLDAVPGMAALRQEMATATTGTESVSSLVYVRQTPVFVHRGPGDVVADVLAGSKPHRTLFRGHDRGKDRQVASLYASDAAGRVAIVYSIGGNERGIVQFSSLKGDVSSDELTGVVLQTPVRWSASGDAVFYTRYRDLPSGTPESETWRGTRVFCHRIGTSQAEDIPVFGKGVRGSPELVDDDLPTITIDNQFAAITVDRQAGHPNLVYFKRAADVDRAEVPWTLLVDDSQGVRDFALHDGRVYALTKVRENNCELVVYDLTHRDSKESRTLLPAGSTVLESVVAAEDALYVTRLDAGIHSLLAVGYDGSTRDVPLPAAGAIADVALGPGGHGVVLRFESWTLESRWLLVRNSESAPAPADVYDAPRRDERDILVERRWYHSSDGTRVPITILRSKDTPLRENGPAVLVAYGAFGYSQTPRYDATRMPWFRRGGTTAIAHVRGGGDLGPAWHEAGRGAQKPKSIDDFVAAGDYLLREHIASSGHLGAWAESAGGILVGMAMARRPDLFSAAVVRVGVFDVLGFVDKAPVGPACAEELGGTGKDARDALRAIDPYRSLSAGQRYPPLLLLGGRNDPRVQMWQSTKFAARLEALGMKSSDVLVRVTDDGHGVGSSIEDWARIKSDIYGFLLWRLSPTALTSPPPHR